MEKQFKLSPLLIIGVIIFLIGCIQPFRYENAKENGYEVDATIVEVVKKDESDADSVTSSTSYTIYADYEAGGKEYKHVRVGKYYDTDKYQVGKTIKVVVDPGSPEKPMFEGGVLCVIGFLTAGCGIFAMIRGRKKAKGTGEADE